jgi:AcrR family transcriptional regulator
MPKVTEAHRAARRDQILQAAWKCFARKGFHGTSMADVIAEAGLSAGAVYLYFRSKDDIIVGVTSEVFGGIEQRLLGFLAQDEPPSPAAIIDFLVAQPVIARAQAPADLFPLLMSVWSEASRNPTVNEVAGKLLAELRTVLGQAVDRWVDAGHRLQVPPDHLASVMMALVQGMVMQLSIDGQPPFDEYRATGRGLFEGVQVV